MYPVEFVKTYGTMLSLMQEPAMVLSNEAVDRTEVETATFLWDPADADSDVTLTRSTEYDVGNLVVSHSAWEVVNAPTVSNVTTDQAVNTEITSSGATTLTITGTNFGAEDADLEVLVYVQPADGNFGPLATGRADGRFPVAATITAVNGADTQITATVVLLNNYGGRVVRPGICEVEVRNTKRFLKSSKFSGLSVVS